MTRREFFARILAALGLGPKHEHTVKVLRYLLAAALVTLGYAIGFALLLFGLFGLSWTGQDAARGLGFSTDRLLQSLAGLVVGFIVMWWALSSSRLLDREEVES